MTITANHFIMLSVASKKYWMITEIQFMPSMYWLTDGDRNNELLIQFDQVRKFLLASIMCLLFNILTI